MSFSDLGKTVGAMWKQATPEEKKPFEAQAAKDRERFNRETAAYNQAKAEGGTGGASSSGEAALGRTSRVNPEMPPPPPAAAAAALRSPVNKTLPFVPAAVGPAAAMEPATLESREVGELDSPEGTGGTCP